MQYNWLLFDADNTLFDFDRSAEQAFAQALEIMKIGHQPDYFKLYKEISDSCWRKFEDGLMTADELRRERFHLFFLEIQAQYDPLEANACYLKELANQALLLDGARSLLERLRRHNFRMSIITNGLKEVQRPRLAKAALDQYFDVIVVSDEIGHSKPDEAFFEYTFQQLGRPDKERMLVIGDNLNSDIRGGQNFGLKTCWFNPLQQKNTTDVQPNYEIQHLRELEPLLF